MLIGSVCQNCVNRAFSNCIWFVSYVTFLVFILFTDFFFVDGFWADFYFAYVAHRFSTSNAVYWDCSRVTKHTNNRPFLLSFLSFLWFIWLNDWMTSLIWGFFVLVLWFISGIILEQYGAVPKPYVKYYSAVLFDSSSTAVKTSEHSPRKSWHVASQTDWYDSGAVCLELLVLE